MSQPNPAVATATLNRKGTHGRGGLSGELDQAAHATIGVSHVPAAQELDFGCVDWFIYASRESGAVPPKATDSPAALAHWPRRQ
jgi:hypothetical protein